MKKYQIYINNKKLPFAEGEAEGGTMDKHKIANQILIHYDNLMKPIEKITIKFVEVEE